MSTGNSRQVKILKDHDYRPKDNPMRFTRRFKKGWSGRVTGEQYDELLEAGAIVAVKSKKPAED